MDYVLLPPPWRAPLRDADLAKASGYPDLYEIHAHQDEDVLSEANVTRGFSGRAHVQSETFSAHSMINEKLQGGHILPELSTLVSEVQKARQDRATDVGSHHFELPGRTTLTQSKLEAWITDLADPAVPLAKLAKNSVPRGYTHEKLLELYAARRVPVERAVWYLRAIGANDIRAGQTQDADKASSYTETFTIALCDALKRLLNEIVLPSNMAGGARVAIKGKVRATLTDPFLRQNWGSRFGYMLLLIRQLCSEGLVSLTIFLGWQVQQLQSAHFGQLPFAVHLIDAYFDEHLQCGSLCKRITEHALERLRDVENDALRAFLSEVQHSLRRILEMILIARPSSFVQPLVIVRHRALLLNTYALPLHRPHLGVDECTQFAGLLQQNLAMSMERADVLLCERLSDSAQSNSASQMYLIAILDKVRFPCDLTECANAFFAGSTPTCDERVKVLLDWSIEPSRSAPSQPYVAGALLHIHCHSYPSYVAKLQTFIEAWIARQGNLADQRGRILHLLEDLISRGLFSYARYYDAMVASGETEYIQIPQPNLHGFLLRCLPQANPRANASRRDIWNEIDAEERRADSDLHSWLVDDSQDIKADAQDQVRKRCASLQTFASRSKFASAILAHITSMTTITRLAWCKAAFALCALKDYHTLGALCTEGLRKAGERALLRLVADTISLYLDVWVSISTLTDLVSAMLKTHLKLHKEGIWPVSATELLMEIETDFCSAQIRRHIDDALLVQSDEMTPENPAVDEFHDHLSPAQATSLCQARLHRKDLDPSIWLRSLFSCMWSHLQHYGLVEEWADVLEVLNERPHLKIGDIFLEDMLHKGAAKVKDEVIASLVSRNVITMPHLISGYILPALGCSMGVERNGIATYEVEQHSISAESAPQLLHLLERLMSPEGAEDLELAARWRSLCDSEAFFDLVAALSVSMGYCISTAIAEGKVLEDALGMAAGRAVMSSERFRLTFLRNNRRAIVAFCQGLAITPRSGYMMLLDEVKKCVLARKVEGDMGAQILPVATSDVFLLLPDYCRWHVGALQLDLQLRLRQSEGLRNAIDVVQEVLTQVIGATEFAVAETLVISLSLVDFQSVTEALLIRLTSMLAAAAIDPHWNRVLLLIKCLLTDQAARPLRPSKESLSALLELTKAAIESTDSEAVRRGIFALCIALRCEEAALNACEMFLANISEVLITKLRLAYRDAMCPLSLTGLLEDVLSFHLDCKSALSSTWASAREAFIRDGLEFCGTRLAWLLRRSPHIDRIKPVAPSSWEVFEVAPLTSVNSASLDLAGFAAILVAKGRAARQKPDGTPLWVNHAGVDQGAQIRFDSEWPLTREPVICRNFRRGILEDPQVPTASQGEGHGHDMQVQPKGMKRKATDDGRSSTKMAMTAKLKKR